MLQNLSKFFRLLAVMIVFTSVLSGAITAHASDVEEVRAQVKEAAALHRLQKIYRQLEYESAELMYLQSLAIQGGFGNWKNIVAFSSTDAFRLQDRVPQIRGRVKQMAAAIERNKDISEDEARRVKQVIDKFYSLLDAGMEIYQLISEEDVDGANELWLEKSKPLRLDIQGEIYTLNSELDSRIGKALLKARM